MERHKGTVCHLEELDAVRGFRFPVDGSKAYPIDDVKLSLIPSVFFFTVQISSVVRGMIVETPPRPRRPAPLAPSPPRGAPGRWLRRLREGFATHDCPRRFLAPYTTGAQRRGAAVVPCPSSRRRRLRRVLRLVVVV